MIKRKRLISISLSFIMLFTIFVALPTTVYAKSSKYLTKAKESSYVKTKKKLSIGYYYVVDKDREATEKKKIYVPKGTVLKVNSLKKKNGKVTANFDIDALSNNLSKKFRSYPYGDFQRRSLLKSNFTIVKKPTPITLKNFEEGSTAERFAETKSKYFKITSNNYLEMYDNTSITEKGISTIESKKFSFYKVKGNNTYLYFKKPLSNLKTTKIKTKAKKTYYRLTIKNLKKSDKYIQYDGEFPERQINAVFYSAKYTVGGESYYITTFVDGD